MAITKQKRMVEQEIGVLACDGPECTVSVAYDGPDDRAPAGWIYVQLGTYHMYPRKWDEPTGPWHFHSNKCLYLWSKERVYGPPKDEPPEGEAKDGEATDG